VNEKLRIALNCSEADVKQLYYPSALSVVEGLAIMSKEADRSITKATFLDAIDSKNILYSRWYLEDQGLEQFCRKIRKTYFSHTNIPPYERFFVIEWNKSVTMLQLKEVVLELGKKWSTANKSLRKTNRFAPFICIVGMPTAELLALKSELYSEGHTFVDGYPFRESCFQLKNISMPQTVENQISLRFVEYEKLETTVANVFGTKEIYEFYSFKKIPDCLGVKHVRIPFQILSSIVKMI
jgi:hypothetical protein